MAAVVENLKRPRRERVAALGITSLVAATEPAHALLGAAMGKGVGDHATLGAALDGVVADGAGGAEAALQITLLQRDLAVRDRARVGRPDTGVAVGLQLDPHRAALGAASAGPAAAEG